jgi:hypothetical protein
VLHAPFDDSKQNSLIVWRRAPGPDLAFRCPLRPPRGHGAGLAQEQMLISGTPSSTLGHSETSAAEFGSPLFQQVRTFGCASLRGEAVPVLQRTFAVRIQFFPVLLNREFHPPSLVNASVKRARAAQYAANSLYFPGDQGIWPRRHVRRSLPAQPPSRQFSGSLPTLTKPSGRSPPERMAAWEGVALLTVHLFRRFLGITRADEQMLPRSS